MNVSNLIKIVEARYEKKKIRRIIDKVMEENKLALMALSGLYCDIGEETEWLKANIENSDYK